MPPLGLSSVVGLMAVYDFLLLNACNTNLHPSVHCMYPKLLRITGQIFAFDRGEGISL